MKRRVLLTGLAVGAYAAGEAAGRDTGRGQAEGPVPHPGGISQLKAQPG